MRLPRSFALVAVGLLFVGCGGSKEEEKPKSADDWDPMEMEQASKGASDDSGSTDDTSGEVSDEAPTTSKPPPAIEQDYDITYSDCKALAATYRGAWLSEEMKKLNAKKLKPKQFERAQQQVEQAATEAGDQWYSACEGIAGSPFKHSRLKCALGAKTVQRFNDCWDGKVEE